MVQLRPQREELEVVQSHPFPLLKIVPIISVLFEIIIYLHRKCRVRHKSVLIL